MDADSDCEVLWVKVEVSGNKPLFVGAYYKPEENNEQSLLELNKSLSFVSNRGNITWLLGDFNMPKMDWPRHSPSPDCKLPTLYSTFTEILDDHNLQQLVDTPTRGENILDLFCTNNPTLVSKVSTIPGLSDHSIVLVESTIRPKVSKVQPRNITLYKKADWEGFKASMSKFKEHVLLNKCKYDVESLWSDLKQHIEDGIKQHIPSKRVSGKNKLPWVTVDIKRLIRKRDKLFYRQRTSGVPSDRVHYKNIKHLVQRKMRTAYNRYVEDILGLMDTHITEDVPAEKQTYVPKKLFTFLKHAKQDSGSIATLKEHGKEFSGSVDKANILNRQFQSVFSPKSPLSLKQLCQMKVSDINQDPAPDSRFQTMPEIEVGSEGISKLLKNLKTDKAAGPDQIKPLLLKELHQQLSPIIQVLFQLSLDSGTLPQDWVTANVSPLFKKGDRTKPANYRPISLTCILCKTLEHIVTSNLVKHFTSNNILYDLQHGFREKRSCETQLVMLVDELARNIQKGKQTDLVLLDFSKAFDKVSHEKLIFKLHQYGIKGKNLEWIRAFLNNRSQQVVVDGIQSSSIPVTSGVPQGSVLGPILFLAYINDLPEHVTSQVRLFADDTVIYITLHKQADSIALQKDLQQLERWESLWDMEFNPGKCQVIHVSTSRSPINTQYVLHGQVLETVSSARYLGVDISNDLSWKTHINRITSNANKSLGFLKRNIKANHPQLKAMAYKAVVRPQLEYASCVWDPYTAIAIKQIEMVQRRAARWVVRDYSFTSSVTSIIEDLGWRTLEQRRSDARLSLMFKIVHQLVAISTDQLVPPSRPTRHSHSSSFRQLQATKNVYKYSFFPLTIVQWNRLPDSVVSLPQLDPFKVAVSGIHHLKP